MPLFNHIKFVTSVNHLADLPAPTGIEIAFAGRSNAGKSSAINYLTNKKGLAYVSKTPGRTQLINFFEFAENHYLVDLPGYGYAAVPEKIKRHWKTVLSDYLQHRASLYGMVLIMDVRHPLTPLDEQMLEWFLPTQKFVHILLTKSDKLSKQQAVQTLRNLEATLQRREMACTVQLFSSLKRQGADTCEMIIEGWLKDATRIAADSPVTFA